VLLIIFAINSHRDQFVDVIQPQGHFHLQEKLNEVSDIIRSGIITEIFKQPSTVIDLYMEQTSGGMIIVGSEFCKEVQIISHILFAIFAAIDLKEEIIDNHRI